MYRNKNPVNQAFWMVLSCFLRIKIHEKIGHWDMNFYGFYFKSHKKSPRNSEAFLMLILA